MIGTVTLTNFRQHENLTVTFTEGLNVIRGANEGGKTTVVEAVLYALFGTGALREPVEATVTWGKEPKTLKVSAEISDQSGTVYTFTRSKGGAEVAKSGEVFVTGQKEVTSFAAMVLGADAKTAGNLMLSGQKGLRGVLDEGPKATSQVIESLANFDLFDTILDAASQKLTLGSTAPLQSRADLLATQIQDLPEVQAPDEAAFLATKATLEAESGRHQLAITQQLKPEYDVAINLWRSAGDIRNKVASLRQELARWDAQVTQFQGHVDGQSRVADEPMPDLTEINAKLEVARDAKLYEEKFSLFSSLPKVTRSVDRKAWEAEVFAVENSILKAKAEINTAQGDIRVLQAKKIAATVCGLCGKDVSELPEVQQKNNALDEDINKLRDHISELEAIIKKGQADLSSVPFTRNADAAIMKGARQLGDFVTVNDSVIPAAVSWNRAHPGDVESLDELQRISEELTARQKRIQEAIGRRDAYQSTLAATKVERQKVQDQIDSILYVDDDEFNRLERAYLTVAQRIAEIEQSIEQNKVAIKQVTDQFSQVQREFEFAKQRKTALSDQLAQTKADIATTEFNNTLVRKVRAARPVVANKLWNIVLTLVSQQFTKMRGVPSTVTRGTEGFLVNGKPITGLSGSALDLLGLAVRNALVRTFIPGCSMMVLDEPAAACDDNRSMSLLSFIAASNFGQVILITHEDVSESFAANLIQL